jgi:hypothetical protein
MEPAASIFRVAEGDKWGSIVGDSEGKATARALSKPMKNSGSYWSLPCIIYHFFLVSSVFYPEYGDSRFLYKAVWLHSSDDVTCTLLSMRTSNLIQQ